MENALIIERLIECRKKLGITKQEAAKECKCHSPHIYDMNPVNELHPFM